MDIVSISHRNNSICWSLISSYSGNRFKMVIFVTSQSFCLKSNATSKAMQVNTRIRTHFSEQFEFLSFMNQSWLNALSGTIILIQIWCKKNSINNQIGFPYCCNSLLRFNKIIYTESDVIFDLHSKFFYTTNYCIYLYFFFHWTSFTLIFTNNTNQCHNYTI